MHSNRHNHYDNIIFKLKKRIRLTSNEIKLIEGLTDSNLSAIEENFKTQLRELNNRQRFTQGNRSIDYPYRDLLDSLDNSTLLDGLVAYYKLNESSGDALDSVGSNDGTVNGATQGATGKIGTAYSFDGVNDFVNVGDSNDLDFGASQDFAISIWFKLNGTAESRILQKHSSRGYGIFVSADSAGDISFRTWGTTVIKAVDTTNYDDGMWHLVVAIRSSGMLYLYVDGSLTASISDGDRDLANAGDFVIGADSVKGNTLNGFLDEIGIWSRALTSDERTELYNSGAGKTHPFT